MTAADILTDIVPHLVGIPAGDVISIHITPYMQPPEVRIHIHSAAGSTLADALCDRATEVVKETRVGGVPVSGHHQCPIRDRPGYALVWCA